MPLRHRAAACAISTTSICASLRPIVHFDGALPPASTTVSSHKCVKDYITCTVGLLINYNYNLVRTVVTTRN